MAATTPSTAALLGLFVNGMFTRDALSALASCCVILLLENYYDPSNQQTTSSPRRPQPPLPNICRIQQTLITTITFPSNITHTFPLFC
ncbi:hypothetical protein E2C01_012582 [Portunus trituberculatus]|uniref:Uncharacterized protein n=1 Tax=Portunus trituberculatus TaxID=210409 RepID=A0A5B7DEM2_PORTR|nr:hypothetical protein [Portunus trituberculatus]